MGCVSSPVLFSIPCFLSGVGLPLVSRQFLPLVYSSVNGYEQSLTLLRPACIIPSASVSAVRAAEAVVCRETSKPQLPRLQALDRLSEDGDPQAHGEVMTGEKEMRFAIIESGGKQYRAVEGQAIEVDRLPLEAGKKFNLERVLLMADGDDVLVGTPLLDGIEVKVTVADHIRGPKIDRFKYRPKKRIRVRGGHRQQYTLLMVDFIGKPGEERKVEKPVVEEKQAEVEVPVEVEEKPKAEKKAKAAKAAKEPKEAKASTKKTSAKKTEPKKK